MTSKHNSWVLVTGSSRGIGAQTAIEHAKRGHNIIVHYNSNNAGANRVLATIVELGVQCEKVCFDLNSLPQDLDVKFPRLKDVSILVNNAGVASNEFLFRCSDGEIDRVLNSNIKGTIQLTREVCRHMSKRKHGVVVNVSSVVAQCGNPAQSVYSASKAALIGFTRSLALELARRDIRVNAVAPGWIETDMTATLSEAKREDVGDRIPLTRMGTPEDVAKAIAFLTSSDAAYITGQVINVNGGLYMG